MKIVATLSDTIQTTEDTWRIKKISNIFDSQYPIDEIMQWAHKHNKHATFDMLTFTEIIG
jgi:hypothetical protein